MNVYGCIPASFLPPHSALTYWAQAASLAGIVSSDPNLMRPNNFALELKKSQLPLNLCDALRKSNSESTFRAVSRANEDLPSTLRVSTSRLGAISSAADAFISLEDQERLQLQIHMQMQHLRRHHQQQHQLQQQHQHQHEDRHKRSHHQPFSSSSPPPVGNGLAPLQALCDSDVSVFRSKSSSLDGGVPGAHKTSAPDDSPARGVVDGDGLKFGINRILSEDFGKTKNEKENSFQLSSVPEECRSLTLCPCSSAQCTAYAPRPLSPIPYPRTPLPSLSAVHALQPPCYPLSSSVDALPGPYSILSSDPSSSSNQPKRKRSWSRAVFSNLQRKGLEKRFEVQKYVTKPDRRQLAAMLGLTDAQVKVWFQNRRMKWRHAQQQQENKVRQATDTDTMITEELDELRKYHSHTGSDSSAEKGLDLRRLDFKGESFSSGAENELCETGTSLYAPKSEDPQSPHKTGSGLQPPKATTSGLPMADRSQAVPKDKNSGNHYGHPIFTSTPNKNVDERPQIFTGAPGGDEGLFSIQYTDGTTPGSSSQRGEAETPAKLDLSSAMQATPLLIQTHGKANAAGPGDVEAASNDETIKNDAHGGMLEDCQDAASIIHIDVDN